MIKAKVIKPFYCAKDKELYLDENRFKELEEQGYVIGIDFAEGKDNQVETATVVNKNDKTRVLSK